MNKILEANASPINHEANTAEIYIGHTCCVGELINKRGNEKRDWSAAAAAAAQPEVTVNR